MRFGFIVHPLTAFQRRLYGLRALNPRLMRGKRASAGPQILARLALKNPFGMRAEGLLVGVPWLPEELITDQEGGVAAVIDAVQLCVEHGADVVGLGAVAAVIGGQGKAVAAAVDVPITTGNGFTAWAAISTLEVLRRQGLPRAPIGLLGPPGPVAHAVLAACVEAGEQVRVVSEHPPKPLMRRLAKLTATGPGTAEIVPHVDNILMAGQLLITASSTGGRLAASELPTGSLVIDVAEPRDVKRDRRRDDILILDGEYVRLPRWLRGGIWQSLYGTVTGQQRHIFACYAEPMLFGLAERTDLCSVGRTIPAERLGALGDLAADHGFWVDRLFSESRAVSPARLQAILSQLQRG